MTKIRWHEGTASHMQIKENKGVTWLTYPAFEQFTDIVHGFSTRLGGVSEGIYAFHESQLYTWRRGCCCS